MSIDGQCDGGRSWDHPELAGYYLRPCDNGPTCSGLSSRDIFGAEATISCGARPLTAEELDFFGPEASAGLGHPQDLDWKTRHVVPCDGTITGDAILFGPTWVSKSYWALYGCLGRPPTPITLCWSGRLRHAASSGEDAAICQLLGRHEFDDANTCTRCGIMREMLIDTRPRRTRVKITVDDRSPRYRRGPAHTPHDSGDGAFERARRSALGMMGDALKARRERS